MFEPSEVVYKFIVSDKDETPWLEVWAANHCEAGAVACHVYPREWVHRIHNTHEEMILTDEHPTTTLLTS